MSVHDLRSFGVDETKHEREGFGSTCYDDGSYLHDLACVTSSQNPTAATHISTIPAQEDNDNLSELSSAPSSPQLSPSNRGCATAQLSTPGQTLTDSTRPLFGDANTSSSTAGKMLMLDDLANLINTAIPWERFTAQHGIDGKRLQRDVLTPLLLPLYQAASADIDAFVKAVTTYHLAKKHTRTLMDRQERLKARQAARDLYDYEKMRAKERWRVRKMAHRKDLADMQYELAAMKTGRKSRCYRSLEAAIRARKNVLAREKARRQVEKETAKLAWKVREAEIVEMGMDDKVEEN
ncbi:MAG: hypothetical protein L6R40_002104 [Gallowayella cf. fulva]|nr:MAG: hypothetical protein L6R40_002104 [Xanthomendoza cf. fulva]